MKTISLPIVRSISRLISCQIFRRRFRRRLRVVRPVVSLVATTPVILIAAMALAVAPPARAQSALDSSAVSDPAYDGPPPVADPPADVPIEAHVPLATAASASASDDAAPGNSDSMRLDDSSDDDDDEDSDNEIPANQVLELPQVIDPASGQPAAATAQVSTGDDSSSPDEVGGVDEYKNENDPDFPGASLPQEASNPYAVSEFRAVPVNPVFLPRYIVVSPMGGIARPGMNGMNTAIGTSSPMFPMRRGFAPIQAGFGLRAFRR